MAGPGAQLTQAHRIQQINNGAAGAALIVELGKLLKTGKLDEQGFITAVVGADLLTQQAAVRLARQYMTGFRALVDPSTDHAELVSPEFDAGASAGRAVNALRELEETRKTDPEQRNWDSEFARIVGQLAVHSDRAAKNAGRETVVASAEANGKRWRRVTDGNPCSFCAMLAGRGPVYRSEDAAGIVVGSNNYGTAAYKAGDVRYGGKVSRGARKGQDRTRGSRGLGEKYHNFCGCSVEECLVEWEPTAREQEFADLYNRAVEACQADGIPASTSNVLGKMRELGDGIVNDAHQPETATGGAGGNSKPPRRTAGDLDGADDRPRRGPASSGDPLDYPSAPDGSRPPFGPEGRPHVAKGSQNHILDRHSPTATGYPRKTKFPEGWSDAKIMDAVDLTIAAPDVVQHFGDKFTFSKQVDGVTMRVVVRVDKPRPFVWTAYPLP